jgi:predicted P-loop ATPase
MRFWRCIPVETQADFDRMVYFGTKWLVSIVASIYGDPSPLVLILAGEKHGTGKTEVFRNLLPKDWRTPIDYYAESKLDGKEADDAVLMSIKLIIMDDEFGGQSKKEHRRFKATTSKKTFSVRKSYGRNPDDLSRLAVLCGTCQELEILNDPTGDQRRLLPIHVIDTINYEEMNKIDRAAMWVELFRMYKAGYDYKVLKDDITTLGINAEKFTEYSLEYELIKRYFEVPNGAAYGLAEMSASEIKVVIDTASGQRTNLGKIGQELKRLGYTQITKKRNGTAARLYNVIEVKPGGLQTVTVGNTEF